MHLRSWTNAAEKKSRHVKARSVERRGKVWKEVREQMEREMGGGGGENHRADSACLCFHFPPQDSRSRGRQIEWCERA